LYLFSSHFNEETSIHHILNLNLLFFLLQKYQLFEVFCMKFWNCRHYKRRERETKR